MMMVGLLIALLATVQHVRAPPPLCDHQTTWRLSSRDILSESKGYIVLVALMPLQCNICHTQLSKLQAIAVALREVRVVVVGPLNEDNRVVDRYRREFPDITISKELEADPVWQKLTARAHDHLIYDRCGRLAFTVRLPRSDIQNHEDTIKSLKSAINYARCGWCQYDPRSSRSRLTPQINAYLHRLSNSEASTASSKTQSDPRRRPPVARTRERIPKRPTTTTTTELAHMEASNAGQDSQRNDPQYHLNQQSETHMDHRSREDDRKQTNSATRDNIRSGGATLDDVESPPRPRANQEISNVDPRVSNQNEEHDRNRRPHLEQRENSVRASNLANERQQHFAYERQQRVDSRTEQGQNPYERTGSDVNEPAAQYRYPSTNQASRNEERQWRTGEDRQDVRDRQYMESAHHRQQPRYEQDGARYPQPDQNQYSADQNMRSRQLGQAAQTDVNQQWISGHGLRSEQNVSGSRPVSRSELDHRSRHNNKQSITPKDPSGRVKPVPSLYDSGEELDYDTYETEIAAPTVAPFRDQIPPPPIYSTRLPAGFSEFQSADSWPTPFPFADVPCAPFTDEVCFHQLKRSGIEGLNKCCKKGIYMTDVCVPGRCSNATVQICCVQKFLQAKYMCCEDEKQEKSEASDSFNRCCYDKFVEEQDLCCPLHAAKYHWLTAHELCLPNVKVDLDGVQIEAQLSENQKLLVDFEENRVWDHECKYGGSSIQYFYMPEDEEPSGR